MTHSFNAAKLLDVYAQAANAKDVDAFMSLYHADARIFDTWGQWSCDGAAAWRTMVEGWFGSLGSERVQVEFEDVVVIPGDEVASLHGFASYAGISANGVRLRSMQNRITWVLRRDGNEWRVMHEHTSVPVSLDHAKAILQRV